MTSKECPKRIDERNYLTQREHNEFLGVVKQDLDRLEKLEKTIELLKARIKIETYHEPKSRYYYLYIGGRIVLLSREEYELLKEVLENETKIK